MNKKFTLWVVSLLVIIFIIIPQFVYNSKSECSDMRYELLSENFKGAICNKPKLAHMTCITIVTVKSDTIHVINPANEYYKKVSLGDSMIKKKNDYGVSIKSKKENWIYYPVYRVLPHECTD